MLDELSHTINGQKCQANLLRERSLEPPSLSSVAYKLHTLYLFTYSDLKTVLLPSIIFSLLNAPILSLGCSPTLAWLFTAAVRATIWAWLNLLLFCLHNQRLTGAISEDSLNKPWRPLPAQRLSQRDASRLLLVLYPILYMAGAVLGGLQEIVVLTGLNFLYNDLEGAESGFLPRNLINACGIVCYAAGSLKVAVGSCGLLSLYSHSEHLLNDQLILLQPLTGQWLTLIGVVVFSTIHASDLRDRAGDAVRQRRTLPLLIGDWASRWSVVIPLLLCSVLCAWFWAVGVFGYIMVGGLGAVFTIRTLTKRTAEDDRVTFRIWSAWIIAIYALPLVKKMGV